MEYNFGYDFTRTAEADLSEIVSYMAVALGNRQAASDWLDELQKRIDETRLFPESGMIVENEFLLVGNYIMYYISDMDKQMIHILRIVYGKRNLDEIMSELHR
jgi:toxin ParE1/3/4